MCGARILRTRKHWHVVMMVSNFFVPGIGTIMNGLCFHQDPEQTAEYGNVLMGLG